MARKIQFKRGLKKNLPTLSPGEMAYTTDEKSAYIGDGAENIRLLDQKDKGELTAQLADTAKQSDVVALQADLNNKATKQDIQQLSLAFKESYPTLTALESAYPSGDNANHVVLADKMIYTYKNGWVNTGLQGIGTGIAEGTVTEKALSNYVKTNVNLVPTIQSRQDAVKDIFGSMDYVEKITERKLITSGTYQSDKAISSTFAGYAIPLKYTGETFNKVRAYVITENANVEIRCSLMDTKLNYLVSSVAVVSFNGAGWVEFLFDETIDNTRLNGSVFYLGIETVGHSARLSTANTLPSEQFAGNAETLKTYWTATNKPDNLTSSPWVAATSGIGTIVLAEIKNTNLTTFEYAKKDTGGKISLPPKIHAVVGKEVNLYFDNIISGYYEDYFIDITCSIGTQQIERWYDVPTEEGNFPLVVALYDKNYKEIERASTSVIVKAQSVGNRVTKKALFIGSSSTKAGVYTGELLSLFQNDAMSLQLIGTTGTSPNLNEGRGGWSYKMYYSNAESPFVFDGVFNYKRYVESNSLPIPDYTFFQLGINDMFSHESDSKANEAITEIIQIINSMITNIKTNYPNMKVGIVTNYPAGDQDAFGKDYKTGQTAWRYKRNWFLLARAMNENFKNRESELVYIVPVQTSVDVRNGMPVIEGAVNARNPESVQRQSNGVHLSNTGYYQMADQIYYWIKGQEK